MSRVLPTVKVHDPENPDDHLWINESDLVTGGYVEWGSWPTDDVGSTAPKRRGRPPGSGKASE